MGANTNTGPEPSKNFIMLKSYLPNNLFQQVNNNNECIKQPCPIRCLNIAGIENFVELQATLPKAWSLPELTAKIR